MLREISKDSPRGSASPLPCEGVLIPQNIGVELPYVPHVDVTHLRFPSRDFDERIGDFPPVLVRLFAGEGREGGFDRNPPRRFFGRAVRFSAAS